MPSVTLKGIPDSLYIQLKQQAAARRRSLNSEILFCLERAVAAQPVDTDQFLARADALRIRLKLPHLTEGKLRAARTSGRP